MKRTWSVAGIALLLAVLYMFRAPFSMRIAERGIERSLAAQPFAALPDGISLVLCGAGGPLPDPKRSGPCVAVQAGNVHLVIDAGSGGARGPAAAAACRVASIPASC